MSITRMLGLRYRLRGLASPVPLEPRARISPPSPPLLQISDDALQRVRQMNRNPLDNPALTTGRLPRLLPCGWCYEENGEEVHPHPECPLGQPGPDAALALSELEGRVARTVQRLERLAHELDARHQRYAWTEQLRVELLAIAHDTPAPR